MNVTVTETTSCYHVWGEGEKSGYYFMGYKAKNQ